MREVKTTVDPHLRLGPTNWDAMCQEIWKGLEDLDEVWNRWLERLRKSYRTVLCILAFALLSGIFDGSRQRTSTNFLERNRHHQNSSFGPQSVIV